MKCEGIHVLTIMDTDISISTKNVVLNDNWATDFFTNKEYIILIVSPQVSSTLRHRSQVQTQ